MSGDVAFAYAGARAQARHGALAPERQWERLSRIPDFTLFVQTARDTELRPWVLNLDARAGPHVIEAALRAQFRARVRAAAQWAPAPWRAALGWIEWLPELPGAAHVLEGAAAPAWLDTPAPPALARAWREGEALPAAWLARWRALWPEGAARHRAALEKLVHLADAAWREARREPAGTAIAALQPRLRRLFRRETRAPAGLAAYLALSWLELLRVRAALLQRRCALPVAA